MTKDEEEKYKKFRDNNKSTDILSFPFQEKKDLKKAIKNNKK